MEWKDVFAPAIDLVFPPRCPLCGRGIVEQTGLCGSCWGQLVIPTDPACRLCARPFGASLPDGGICSACFQKPPLHDGIAAATLYNDASRQLVLAFKHGSRLPLAGMMANLMCTHLPVEIDDALCVPVPLHRWRLWKRGYNQAAELAREISKRQQWALGVDVLLRRKHTRSLGGLGAKARQRTVAGAIKLNSKWTFDVRGRTVVLVDDVLTTGATSNACISVLKRGGVQKVIVACFARVLDEAL